MRQNYSWQAPGPYENGCRIPAKNSGIRELYNGTQESRNKGRMRVSEVEFVEMMNMRNPEVKGRDKDCGHWRETGKEMERGKERAEDELLCYWACHIISPAYPAAKAFMDISTTHPFCPFSFYHALFKKRTSK